ncbi:MAG: DUF6282 family protein [Terriglobia bacterium]
MIKSHWATFHLFAAVILAASAACGQASLNGAIDIHVHCNPDSLPRSIDAIDVARLAKSRGMRALVLKNHFEPTASLAYIVRKEVPGIEIFGGIVLNRTVGGINPAAVEHMVMVKGGWGRVVWMPTFDAEHDTLSPEHHGPRVPVLKDGELLPAVKDVIALAAKYKLTLETGHSSPEEGLMIIREARRQGVQHIVVTHAMLVGMTIPQMREAAKMGAYIEFVYNALIGKGKKFEMRDYAKAIREVGSESCILASDLGQVGNPLPPDGLSAFYTGLMKEGVPEADIYLMSRTNPARALGLQ